MVTTLRQKAATISIFGLIALASLVSRCMPQAVAAHTLALNPQPLPPGCMPVLALNPQPLPPGLFS